MKTIKYMVWHCKYCKTTESCPDLEYFYPTTTPFCPRCGAKGKKRKMIRIEDG